MGNSPDGVRSDRSNEWCLCASDAIGQGWSRELVAKGEYSLSMKLSRIIDAVKVSVVSAVVSGTVAAESVTVALAVSSRTLWGYVSRALVSAPSDTL